MQSKVPPQLHRLAIKDLQMKTIKQWIDLDGPLWSRMSTLSLGGSWFYVKTGKNATNVAATKTQLERLSKNMTKLTELQLATSKRDLVMLQLQLFLVLQNPKLKKLKWVNDDNFDQEPMTQLVKSIKAGKPIPKSLATVFLASKGFKNKEFQGPVGVSDKTRAIGYAHVGL